MRTTTATELLTLAGTTRQVTLRVKIANGSLTMGDLSTYVEKVTIDQDIDQPVSGCTVEFRRDSNTTQSLSPLRSDSTLNVLDDGVTFGTRIDLGRSITIEVATNPIGTYPATLDYKLLFQGTIDVIQFEHSPVTITCRDQGARLVDNWVETEAAYGTAPGRAMELVMQDILDTALGAGAVTLNVPVSPAFLITTYTQQRMSVMDALQSLAQMIGWDVRYKIDEAISGLFQLTLTNPPRTKTTPDYTFGSSSYLDVTNLALDITNIRNAIQVSYRDSTLTPPSRVVVLSSDATSITAYGRRFFGIQEADTSPIDTSAEATTLAAAALSDLKSPKANQEIESPFFWPGDLGDLYRYSANGVHYNSDQDLAAVGVRHELSPGKHRSFLRVRGQPAGGYLTWHQREKIARDRTAKPFNSKDPVTGKVIRLYPNTDGMYSLAASESDGSTKVSTYIAPQGSVIPATTDQNPFSYNAGGASTGNMWVAWTWSAITINKSDGTTISVPASASLATPPSPTLSSVTSGALAGRTRFVRIAYVKNLMMYHPSAEASLVIAVNKLLKITSPPAVAGYDGWMPMVGATSNTEFYQPITAVAFGVDWTEPIGGATIAGVTPYDNTFHPSAVIATNLLVSSTYYFYPFWDLTASLPAFADNGATAKTGATAIKQNQDGRIGLSPFTAMSGLTPAAGVPGSGAAGGGKFL